MRKRMYTRHGKRDTVLYKKWQSMRGRVSSHPHYLDNNITCCDEWASFVEFMSWSLANGYNRGLSLDRINSYGNYEPSNCRWVNRTVQSENIILRKDNKTGYSGVHLERRSGKYKVQIQVNGKKVHLGRFENAIDGARAFDKYVIDNNTNHTLNFGGHYEN